MIRRLGKRWQQLHRLVYIAAIAGVVHFYWLVKADIRRPVQYGAVLLLLLGYRLVTRWAPLIAERFSSQTFPHSVELNGLQSFYAKFLHPRSQGAGIDPKDFRSTLLAVHNPMGFVQSP